MSALLTIAPDLVAEVCTALTSLGRDDLAPNIRTGIVDHCTYDSSVDAGYIYLVVPDTGRYVEKQAASVAETIPFLELGFNIDVDCNGHVLGIEFLNRADFLAMLRVELAL